MSFAMSSAVRLASASLRRQMPSSASASLCRSALCSPAFSATPHFTSAAPAVALQRRHFSSKNSYFSPRSSNRNSHYQVTELPVPINKGLTIVPQQSAYVIERFGKFRKILPPGLHLLLPLIDRIAYVHSLKEQTVFIDTQTAITADNVAIEVDGVLYMRIIDAKEASYGIADINDAMINLAQSAMRSELGKISLDKTFAERESLNALIVRTLNKAAEPWGVQCLRYEIKDIIVSPTVKLAMDMQAEAERKKRATILDSEGARDQEINVAEGERQATVLAAQGEAQAIVARATATAQGIEVLSQAIRKQGGMEAVSLRVAEKYVEAFSQIAKQGTTVLLPTNTGDVSSMVTQALTIFSKLKQQPNQLTGQSNQQSSQSEGDDFSRLQSLFDSDKAQSQSSQSAESAPSSSSGSQRRVRRQVQDEQQ